VGKSEQRELAILMAMLVAHLLKCEFQPEWRGSSRQITTQKQRRVIQLYLKQAPKFKGKVI
jgi:hypothetical protein